MISPSSSLHTFSYIPLHIFPVIFHVYLFMLSLAFFSCYFQCISFPVTSCKYHGPELSWTNCKCRNICLFTSIYQLIFSSDFLGSMLHMHGDCTPTAKQCCSHARTHPGGRKATHRSARRLRVQVRRLFSSLLIVSNFLWSICPFICMTCIYPSIPICLYVCVCVCVCACVSVRVYLCECACVLVLVCFFFFFWVCMRVCVC